MDQQPKQGQNFLKSVKDTCYYYIPRAGKIIKKVLKYFLTIAIFLALIFIIFVIYLCVGKPPIAKETTWGVNFSQKHAKLLKLEWKEAYLALLDDLKVKNIKVAAHWDLLEPEDGNFYFEDLDWQINEAEKRGAKILLAIGMKTPRWPECHMPEWAKNLGKEKQQEKILEMLQNIVLRYKDSPTIKYWQVENEPFFPFGDCQWVDKSFLREEVNLVKSLDILKRPVIISDSGEGSLWISAARFGDIVGTTMYKKVWFRQLGIYIYYPTPPSFFWKKAQLIRKIFKKDVMVVELQAEPWGPKLLYDSPLEEQKKTMDLEQFKTNIDFARRTGLKEFYLWGSEWWFWMKKSQNDSQIWDEAKNLF